MDIAGLFVFLAMLFFMFGAVYTGTVLPIMIIICVFILPLSVAIHPAIAVLIIPLVYMAFKTTEQREAREREQARQAA